MQIFRDEELMLALGRGDPLAFDELVRRHQSAAWSIAYRYCGNREDAEDLTQDAFLRLLAAAPRYRPTASFRTYLTCIITRLCLDYSQKKRALCCEELPEPEDPTPSAEALLITAEQGLAVRRAIAALPPQQRLAVILRYYEGLGYREIAASLENSEKAVERLLARGREALEGALQAWVHE